MSHSSKKRTQQKTIKGQKPVQHVVPASTQSNPLSKCKQLFNHNPRRPWRSPVPSPLLTPRLRSCSHSRQNRRLHDSGDSQDVPLIAQILGPDESLWYLVKSKKLATTAVNKKTSWRMAPLHHGRRSRLQGRSRRKRVTWRLPALVPSRLKNNDAIAYPHLSCLPLRYLLWTEKQISQSYEQQFAGWPSASEPTWILVSTQPIISKYLKVPTDNCS